MAILTPEKQNEIDGHIASVFLATNKTYPDSTLTEIIEHYGIDIATFAFDDAKITGAIKYPDGKDFVRPVILVNKDKSPAQKTFILAHEFGHYLLHPQAEADFCLDYETLGSEDQQYTLEEETEANYFANSLLMPEKLLRSLLNTTSDLGAIAKYFGVSQQGLEVRLAWLRQNQ